MGGAISSITTIMLSRSERQKYRNEGSWELRRAP